MFNSLLNEYGLSLKDIKNSKLLSGFFEIRDETFYKYISRVFSFLESIGYSKKQLSAMAKKFPPIIGYSSDNLKLKMEKLADFGFSIEQIIKMTASLPQIYSYSLERIEKKFQYLLTLGYTSEQIIKMVVVFPSVFSYSIDNINEKMNFLLNEGYTKEQILEITILLPSIFGRSSDNIKNKIDFLVYLGYTKEEALKMTVSNPAIFSHSSNALKEKIEFFKSIGLKYFLVEKPKNLMQSIDLTYARFRYLTVEKNREINKTTVDCLFSSTKRFEQAFGITKEELLGRYSYDAEVRSKRDKNKTKLLEQS